MFPTGSVRDHLSHRIGREVNDGDNGAVNFVFYGATRKNAQLVTSALAIRNLHLAKTGHDLKHEGLYRIGDRPLVGDQ